MTAVVAGRVVELYDHPVAYCLACRHGYRPSELRELRSCPGCNADLRARIQTHLEMCRHCRGA
jgi:uncharacterized CHY-type Zn-finger protein